MTQRGITASERSWLASQLDVWRDDGIISPDQAKRILDLYETPAQFAARGHSLLLTTLMGVAALMVAMAAMLAIGYNWQAMPAAVKLAIIFAVLLATYGVGAYLRFARGAKLASDVAFFLGCLFFGAAIFLIAQIFHLSGHYPDTVWWWALGVLPFALCLDSVLLHALLASLLALWCGMEILGFSDLGGWFWWRWNYLPNGAYSMLLLVLPGLAWAYRRSSVVTVWLYVLALAWWAVIQPAAWRLWELSPLFIAAAGGVLLLIADSHRRGDRLAAPYRELGLLLIAGALLFLSFYEVTEEVFDAREYIYGGEFHRQPVLGQAGATALLAAAAIAGIGVWYLASKLQVEATGGSTVERMFETSRRQWFAIAIVAMSLGLVAWWIAGLGPVLPTVLANIAMVVLAFWLMARGLREDSGKVFAAGVVYFLLWAVTRYIDMFGDFGGMLGAAGVFLLCGLALFGVAWFWRQRKGAHHG